MDAPDSAGISEQAIQTIYCDESGFTGRDCQTKINHILFTHPLP